MSVPDEPLSLAADFPEATREQWRRLVAGVLAKSGRRFDEAAPERALAHRSYDGFEVAPLYTAEDAPVEQPAPGQAPFVRGALPSGATGWDVRTRLAEADPVAVNRAALADLAGGATSLWLRLGAGGLPVAELSRALAGLPLDRVTLDAGAESLDAARAFVELKPASGSFGADPFAAAARGGGETELASLAELWRLAEDHGLRAITVDGTCYADAGGSDSDEIAISIAVAVAYLREADRLGRDAAAVFDELEFRYAVTADQFGSIAKLRAARRVWDRVGELSGFDRRRGQRQHAVTSAAMLTRRDPWVNLLRTTVGCFAAAVGGAEAITVSPFDAAIGVPDDFGRRVARNVQAILHDEASLARVADAAGGSYYVETLTDQLAEAAWATFTELERAGGAAAAFGSGAVAALLERSWQARRDNLAHRRDPLTGVSEFPMLDEAPVSRPAAPQPPAGGLPVHRYPEEYEEFRDRSDAQLSATGHRPAVFLAALGPAAVHSARLGFAANLFAAGGLQPITGTGDPAALAEAFAASGARLACLCSSDKVYAEQAAEVATALAAAGATVWIAGKPALATGAIAGAVYAGCDALATLHEAYRIDSEVPA
ncbi:MAG TPA: methylmalonyl-CoA mutase family protein [Jatrophihabitans sp.]|nr:methylmalonyl-CoA mutase family protein [Jatrophihabitans sp.]